MVQKMDSSKYFKVSEMERSGKTEEGFVLQDKLADKNDPLALLDLVKGVVTIIKYSI